MFSWYKIILWNQNTSQPFKGHEEREYLGLLNILLGLKKKPMIIFQADLLIHYESVLIHGFENIRR